MVFASGIAQRARTRHRFEIRVTQLQRHAAGTESLLAQLRRRLLHQITERRFQKRRVGGVLFQRRLPADGAGVVALQYRRPADAARLLVQAVAPLAVHFLQKFQRQLRQIPHGVNAHALELLAAFGSDPRNAADGKRCQKRRLVARQDTQESVGFRHTGGDLRHQLVGRHADRRVDADRVFYFIMNPHRRFGHRTVQALASGQVHIRLVEGHRLHQRRVTVEDVEDASRELAVQMMRSAQKDGVGTQPFGAGDGLCRMDAVFARLIRRRRHHPASLGVAADDHRLAQERRIAHLFHRNKKRIHINVQNRSHHKTLLTTDAS